MLPALRAGLQTAKRSSGPRPGLTKVYQLLDVLATDGVQLERMLGPWKAVAGRREGAGRRARRSRPCVERDDVRIQVDSERRARALAGFLNWCEVELAELRTPVS